MVITSGIYRIVNNGAKKLYIGSAANLSKRFEEHKYTLRIGKHKNSHLQRAWNKYGETAFEFEILVLCSKEELIEREQWWIDYYKDHYGWDKMYNMAKTAGSQLGYKHSEKSKQRMRQSALGRHQSLETIEKRSLALKGRKLSEANKQGISKSNKGRKFSDEHKSKLSEAHLGVPLSEEHKAKMKGRIPWNKKETWK